MRLRYFLLLFVLSQSAVMYSQGSAHADSSMVRHDRLKAVAWGESALAAGSLGGLYFLWYAGYDQSPFHGINDNGEWLLMDKGGHMTSSYYMSKVTFDLLRWSGMDQRRALLFSAPVGFTYLGIVELMDGVSEAWGASPGDLLANTTGTILFAGQQLLWQEQRLQLKWSFHRSPYTAYRPSALGSNLIQEMLKDYNGQTFWLSANLWSLSGRSERMPEWLNIAVGYGGEGMLGARENPVNLPYFERYRQFYISPDIDLSRIRVESEWLGLLLRSLNFIKLPMPAFSLDSRGQFSFHPLYF